tara:strand:- start:395 stop:613 length:219 start_codon:yes stop_codon:yes gene_type:complete
MLRKFVGNPYANLLVGIILISSTFMEVWKSVHEDIFQLGTHHGVMLFGIVQTLKALPDIMEGLNSINKFENP